MYSVARHVTHRHPPAPRTRLEYDLRLQMDKDLKFGDRPGIGRRACGTSSSARAPRWRSTASCFLVPGA